MKAAEVKFRPAAKAQYVQPRNRSRATSGSQGTEEREIMQEFAETESANARARRLWESTPGGTAEDVARLLLKELLREDQDSIIEILLPWITDRVRAARRTDVRAAEQAAWGEDSRKGHRRATAVRTQTGALPAITSLDRLFGLPVLVPGKGPVIWRDMTVEDHNARIGLLRKTVDGTQRTIDKHQWSIREIQRHKGATTLGDIPVTELSRDLEL